MFAAALLLGACSASVAGAPNEQWAALNVSAEPVELGTETVGKLRFRGGLDLVMRGDNREHQFGGLSGLEVMEDGRFIAVSDYGEWVEARLVLDSSGSLVGVTNVRGTVMRDEDSEPFEDKEDADAEDLAQLPDGRFAVSFEQTQSIRIYDLNRDGPFGAARSGPQLADVERLPPNAGLEALAATANGDLIVGAEGGAEPDTPVWLAPIDAREPVAPAARYPLQLGYALTSVDRLPDGGFVALERFYAPVIGPRARITRFGARAVADGGQIEPEELARLAPPMPVDNFEGVSAVRAPNGGVRLYIISDDNFRNRQRTLLLAFDIVEEETN